MAFNFNRSKKEPMSEINVTPFVDVMLVLLIIFMVTAPLLTEEVDFQNLQQTHYLMIRAVNFKHKFKRRNLYSRTSSYLPKNDT